MNVESPKKVEQSLTPEHESKSVSEKPRTEAKSRKDFTEEQVRIMKDWFIAHLDGDPGPYPTSIQKDELAKETGLTYEQVQHWFINARARLWDQLRPSRKRKSASGSHKKRQKRQKSESVNTETVKRNPRARRECISIKLNLEEKVDPSVETTISLKVEECPSLNESPLPQQETLSLENPKTQAGAIKTSSPRILPLVPLSFQTRKEFDW